MPFFCFISLLNRIRVPLKRQNYDEIVNNNEKITIISYIEYMMSDFAIENTINGKRIRRFRKKTGLSRKEFSSMLNISVRTLEKWESKDENVSGPVVLLMKILMEKEELVEYYRLPEKKYPLRLFYMCDHSISTVIDVDIMNQKVSFRNYTGNLILRAFGAKEEVTYEDFERFLESRCFPSERDKMKIQLDVLDLKYYDPLAIIHKTHGRMAEDDCYILFDGEEDRLLEIN